MEEESLFPAIEEKTGEEGIMDGNVEQHRKYCVFSLFWFFDELGVDLIILYIYTIPDIP